MADNAGTVRWRPMLLAEALGTYWLVWCGTGAVVADHLSGHSLGTTGIAAVFGLIVLTLVYVLGPVSGAHLNPAVTLAFAVARRFSWRWVVPYLAAQAVGAVAASFTLRWLFPTADTLGGTLPSPAITVAAAFGLEFLLTLLLMMVILRIAEGSRELGLPTGIIVGAVVMLEALWAGPLCGASMNPARSLGPAVASGHYEHLWLYLLAPVLGAVAAVPLTSLLRITPAASTEPKG